MDLQLRNQAVVITGGSAGIGLACAEVMASEGCNVAIVGRDEARLARAAEQVKNVSARGVHAVQADLSSLHGIEAMIARAHALLGRIDVLVNNAGSIRAGAFLDIPDAQWIEDWNLKLLGYVRAARAVFPHMQQQRGGRIINVIGSAARQVIPNYLVGGAPNPALINFTNVLSDLGAKHGIVAKAAWPGAVRP